MSERLEVIIVGRDEASSAFKGVREEASKTASGVDGLSKQFSSFSANSAKVGAVMSIGVTAPIMMLGQASVDAASDMAESASKMEVVFGPVASEIDAFAKDAARNLGMSRQAATEAAGTFGNLFSAIGLGKPEMASMSTGVLQLSADLASFNNLEPEIVLEKLRSGLVGEVEPLRTLGINLNAAAVEMKAMEMGLVTVGEEISDAAKIQARYALIMEQSTLAQGDFARTADGLANSSRIAKAEAADLSAEMGETLLPIAKTLNEVLRTVIGAFAGLSPEMQTAIVVGAGLLAVIGPLAGGVAAVTGAIGFLLPAVVGLFGFISATAIPAAGALIVALAPILIPIAAVTAAVGLLALAWSNNWGDIQGKTAAAVGFLKEQLNNLIGVLNRFIGAWNNLEFSIPGFSIELPSVEVAGQRIGGGYLGWEGLTVSTPNLPMIPALARGGNILSGGLALVGDRGPELLSLPTGASVAPLSGGGTDLGRKLDRLIEALEKRNVVINLDGREIGRASLDYLLSTQRANVTVGVG